MGSEVFITAIIFITFYLVIELFARRKERLMIVEKMAANQSIDIAAMLKQLSSPGHSFSSLKIGCLMAGLGAGFFMGFLIRYLLALREFEAATLYTGSILMMGAIGLIVAYFIEKPKKN